MKENKTPEGNDLDYKNLKDIKNAKMIDLGFDYNKKDSEISKEDLVSVAKMHGGELLSKDFKTGDIYKKLKFLFTLMLHIFQKINTQIFTSV